MKRSPEATLVALARALFGGDAPGEVQVLFNEAWPAPAKISPQGLRVLEDTLAKGAVLWLVRHGAWRDRRWAHQSLPRLEFDVHSVGVLQWLLEQPLGHEGITPLRVGGGSIGSELLLLAALAAAIESPAERNLAVQPVVRASPLCRIAFPLALGLAGPELPQQPLQLTDAQDFVLGALQPSLARWWRDAEQLKARLLLPPDVLRCGQAQARMLDQLFEWAEKNDKRERCTFLLEAMAPLVHEQATAASFVAPFDERLPMRDRQAARRAAGAALHGVARLAAWDEQARHVRFIDDGYDQAQARVKAYETFFGPARFNRAQRLCDELDALPT